MNDHSHKDYEFFDSDFGVCMFVNMNFSVSKHSYFNRNRSVFICPDAPQFVWDLEERNSLQLAIAFVAIICPCTILLNLLAILAIQKSRRLQANSDILIVSLATADLLVGAVSMPLTIIVDALILQGTVSENIICKTSEAHVFIFYTAFNASGYHLIFIAYDRYVAIVKYLEYRTKITNKLVKRYVVIAWIVALTVNAMFTALKVTGVRYEVILVIDIIYGTVLSIGVLLLLFFYGMVGIKTLNQKRRNLSQVVAANRARTERRVAITLFLLTAAFFVSSVPFIVVNYLAPILPFFRENSIFRWAEIFLQLNSLVNPALYFYRNTLYRNIALTLLRYGKRQEFQPTICIQDRTRVHRGSRASFEVRELVHTKQARSHSLSRTWTAGTLHRLNTNCKGVEPDAVMMNRRMSCPALTNYNNMHVVIQPIFRTVTVHIERAPRKKPSNRNLSNDGKDAKNTYHFKLARSKSVDENSLVGAKRVSQSLTEVISRRCNSMPSFLKI